MNPTHFIDFGVEPPTMDDWGEVINSEQTYDYVAAYIRRKLGGSVLLGWTDEEGTHLDILFSIPSSVHGTIQGGLNWVKQTPYLFVTVIRIGSFGFNIYESDQWVSSYIGEKLSLGDNITSEKVTELIIGICKSLTK